MLIFLSTNQLIKVEKPITLLFLCPYVTKPDKYYRHIIEVHYLQLVGCH